MSRMLLSSSYVLLFLLCLSNECNGRHLSTIDNHAKNDKVKPLNHNSTIKGLGEKLLIVVHEDLNITRDAKGKNNKQTLCGSKNKKDKTKGQKAKKSKELSHGRKRQHQHKLHNPKSVTFQVPSKNKRVHQQPGFNLDYSPPKTHPPSHN